MKTYKIRFIGCKNGSEVFKSFTVKIKATSYDQAYEKLQSHYNTISNSRQIYA